MSRKLSVFYLSLIFLINLLLTNLPLTNLLHYESSSLNAILISLISGLYWLHYYSKHNIKANITFFSLLLTIPFVILLLSTIYCQNCPLDQGIYFYLLFTIPAVFIGIAISQFARFISIKFRYLTFYLIWLFMLLGFAPELYFNPQIYFYNVIFVYYPGVIYDQNIEITSQMVYYRIINLFLSLLIIYLFNRKYYFKQITKLIVIIAFISAYLHSYDFKVSLDLSTNQDKINSSLGKVLNSENFTIHLPDSVSDREIKLVLNEHEYSYRSIINLLGSSTEEKISSFLFESGAQKKLLFGSANADVAKPWMNQIYLNMSNYRSNLKHEIAHIFSAKFGKGPFKVPPNYNPGIIEGFAMAIENNFDNYDINYLAALAFRNDYKVDLKSLFSDMSFFSSASSLSYIYAGSFFKYLSEKYGWIKLTQIYSGESFEKTYNMSLHDLEDHYYKHIDSIEVLNNVHKSNYYFGYKPLIKKYCARATAKELREARKLYDDKNYVEAAQRYLAIYDYSSTYSSLVGFANSKRESGDIYSALELLEGELINYEGTSAYYYLEFLLANFYSLQKDSVNAAKYYEAILDQNPHRSYFRNALVNLTLLKKGESILIRSLNDKEFRKKIISDLVKTEPNEFFIEQLIYSSDITEYDFQNSIELIKEVELQMSFPSHTYFVISKFAYLNMDLETASYYSKKSLQNVDPARETIHKDHNQKLNFILSEI